MKRIFIGAFAALLSLSSYATTYVPVPLLNTTGSTSGQVVLSTGSANLAAWGNVPATALASQSANTVVANVTGSAASPTAFAMPSCSSSSSALQWTTGTGFTCYANSASLTGATFTGASGLSYSNPQFTLNDTSGSNKAVVQFQKNGIAAWNFGNSSTPATLAVDRYVSGSYVDSPLSISNSTGAVTMSDGIANSPISGSTGSFTTLKASSTAKVFATNTSAQSIPSTTATALTNYTTVFDQNSNFAASTGIFTAPVTGFYWVYATASFNGTMAVNTTLQMQIFANGALTAAQISYVASTTPTNYSVMAGALVSLTAGQTVNVKVLQTNATAVPLVATASLNTLSITQIP